MNNKARTNQEVVTILAHCEDKKGIVYSITDFLLKNNGNIIGLDEHVDRDLNHFYIRVEVETSDFDIPTEKIPEFFKTLIADKFKMKWEIHYKKQRPRMAMMVSKYAHCFYDVLARYESKEWDVDIPLIISNHRKFENVAERFGIPYYYIPITKDNKEEQETKQLELFEKHNIDFVVLARYMQIVSPLMINAYKNKIINIHHSFLPAFVGANPYRLAYERGVKFIGASAHYVTEELDAGPIIAQDVIPISHKDSLSDMKRKGADIEKIVFANAIFAHLNRKVLINKNKTVVF